MNHWSIGYLCWNVGLTESSERVSTLPQKPPTVLKNYTFAPIIMNISSNEFYKQPAFYAFGHFSKFILSGSVIIDVQTIVTNAHEVQKKIENINTFLNTDNVNNSPGGQFSLPIVSSRGSGNAAPQEETVMAVASKNPDGSHIVIIYNP